MKSDKRSTPIRRLVVMGESNAYGMNAARPSCEWVQTLANLLREHQDGPLAVINNAIPGNVISPDAPTKGLPWTSEKRTKPSALERYRKDMINQRPDLAVFAYGLNDAATRHEPRSFLAAYEQIVSDTRAKCENALIVLVGPYWNFVHDADAYDAHISRLELAGEKERIAALRRDRHRWVIGRTHIDPYRLGIAEIAGRHGCIFVDIFQLLEGAMWLLHQDGIHFNDVGQSVIGMTVFAAIAAECSFVAAESVRAELELGTSIYSTGGTRSMPDVYRAWFTART